MPANPTRLVDSDGVELSHAGGALPVRPGAVTVEYRTISLDTTSTSSEYVWADWFASGFDTLDVILPNIGATAKINIYGDVSEDQSGDYTVNLGMRNLGGTDTTNSAVLGMGAANATGYQRGKLPYSAIKVAVSTADGAGGVVSVKLVASKLGSAM